MKHNNSLQTVLKTLHGGHLLLYYPENPQVLQLVFPYADQITITGSKDIYNNFGWQDEDLTLHEKVGFIDDNKAGCALQDSAYDSIFLFKKLEKINKEAAKELMLECRRILKPGGKILIVECDVKRQFSGQKLYHDTCVLFNEIDNFFSVDIGHQFVKPVSINNYLEYSEFNITKKINIDAKVFYQDPQQSDAGKEILFECRTSYLPKIMSDKRAVKAYVGRLESTVEQLKTSKVEYPPFVVFMAENSKKADGVSDKVLSYKVIHDVDKMMPREKLLAGMIEEMKLYELIAVLIGMGNKREDVVSLSKRIIREYGSKALAGEREPKRLKEILSIGEVNACKLVSAFELGRRFYSSKVKNRRLIRGPEDVFEHVKEMTTLVKENFRGLYLNSKNYIVYDEVISIGHLTASLVHPREVFKAAFEYSAAGVIVIHNHPSGDPEPSDNDDKITKMLIEGGKILGIPILDHIIVGDGRYYSYNDKGKV